MLHPDALHVDTTNLCSGNIEPSPIPTAASPEEDTKLELLPEKRKYSERLEQIENEKKKTQSTISTLKKRVDTLKEIQEQKDDGPDEEMKDEKLKDLSLAEKIYLQTRTTTQATHIKEDLFVSQDVKLHIMEPNEAPGMEKLMEDFEKFRPTLLNKHRRRASLCEKINRRYVEQYNDSLISWAQKVEKWQNRPTKCKQDQQRRGIYEEIFPDLKNSLDRQVRKERYLQRCDNIPMFLMLSGTNQNEEENKVRANALTVPIMSMRPGSEFFRNENNAVYDESSTYKKRIDEFKSSWTEEEKQTFHAKFALYGKNFAAIKCFLERKTVKDCVIWYYLSKNTMNYKGAFKKNKRKNTKVYKPPMMPKDDELTQITPQLAETKTSGLSAAIDSKCCLCNMKINLTNSSQARVLTRSLYDTYGVDARDTDVKVCSRCQAEVNRNRNSQKCLTRSCDQNKRKSKTLRSLPAKWKTCDERIKRFIAQHFGFPREMTKCCPPCFKKINRKIDQAVAGEIEEEIQIWEADSANKWPKAELDALDRLVQENGRNWEVVCTYLCGRTAEECKIQWEGRNGADGLHLHLTPDEDEEEQDEEKRDEDDGDTVDQEIVDEESTLDVSESTLLPTEVLLEKIKEEPPSDSNDDRASVELEPAQAHPINPNLPVSASPSAIDLKEQAQRADSGGSSDDVVVVDELLHGSSKLLRRTEDSQGANLHKGSITQGTPLRPPSMQSSAGPSTQGTPLAIATQQNFLGTPAPTPGTLSATSQNDLLQQYARMQQLQLQQQLQHQLQVQASQHVQQPTSSLVQAAQSVQPAQASTSQLQPQGFKVPASTPSQQPQMSQEDFLKMLIAIQSGSASGHADVNNALLAYQRIHALINDIQKLENVQQVSAHAIQDVSQLNQLSQVSAQIQEKRVLLQQEEARWLQVLSTLQRTFVQQQQTASQNQVQKSQIAVEPQYLINPENLLNAAKEKYQKAYMNLLEKQKLSDDAQAKLRLLQETHANQDKRIAQLTQDIQKTQKHIDAYQKLNLPKQATYRKDLAKQENDVREAMHNREQAALQIRVAVPHLQARQTQFLEAQQEYQMAQQVFQEAQRVYQEYQQRHPTTAQTLASNQNPSSLSESQDNRQQSTSDHFRGAGAFQPPVTTQGAQAAQIAQAAQVAQAALTQQQLAAIQAVQQVNTFGGGLALAGNEEGREGENLRNAEAAVLNAQHHLRQARDAEKSAQQKIEELRRTLLTLATHSNGNAFSIDFTQLQTQFQNANEECQRMSERAAEAQRAFEQAEARRSQIKKAITTARAGSNKAQEAEEKERQAFAHYERFRSKGAMKDFREQTPTSTSSQGNRVNSPALLLAASSGYPLVPATSPIASSSKPNVSPAIGINRPIMAGGSLSSGRSAVAVSSDENRALLDRVVHEEVSSHPGVTDAQRAVRKSGLGTCLLPQVETHKQLPSQIQRRTASPLNIVVSSRPGSAQLPVAQNSPSIGALSASSILFQGHGLGLQSSLASHDRPRSHQSQQTGQILPIVPNVSGGGNVRVGTPAYEPLSPEATGSQNLLRPTRPPTAISSGPAKEKFSVLDFDDDESSNEITFPGCDQNVPPGPPPPPPPFMLNAVGPAPPANEQSFEPLSDDDS